MDCMEFMWDDVGTLKDDVIKIWTNDSSVSTLKHRSNKYRISANMESIKCRKFQIVVAIIFLLCHENLNTFLTRLRKLFIGRKLCICRNTVFISLRGTVESRRELEQGKTTMNGNKLPPPRSILQN